MKKSFLIGLCVATMLAMVVAPAVLAHDDDTESSPREKTQARIGAAREAAQLRIEEARELAEQRLEQIKDQALQRRLAIKQAVCERRQEQLNSTVPRLKNGTVRVKLVLDTMYDRVQSFYESGQLTVANYDELNAAVAAAQTNAEVAREAVQNYTIELDCENPDLGTQLDEYRTLVKEAREALKSYRAALVDLISSLRAAAATEAEASDE